MDVDVFFVSVFADYAPFQEYVPFMMMFYDFFRQKVNFCLIFRIDFLVRCFLFDASFSAEGKKLVLEKHC